MIDQEKKRALIAYVQEREQSDNREILLPTERYFDGYDHHHCTVCANAGAYPTSLFADRLRAVAGRPDVQNLWVRFLDYSDALEFEDSWIGSDSVYVVTTAEPEAVLPWFADFKPSDAWEDKELTRFPDVAALRAGFRLVAVWWD